MGIVRARDDSCNNARRCRSSSCCRSCLACWIGQTLGRRAGRGCRARRLPARRARPEPSGRHLTSPTRTVRAWSRPTGLTKMAIKVNMTDVKVPPVRLEFPILSLHPGLRHRCVAPDVWGRRVAGGGAAALVEEAGRHAGRLTGGAPRRAPAADGDAVAVEDQRAIGITARQRRDQPPIGC